MGWREFLPTKAASPELEQREALILGWFERHPAPPAQNSPSVLKLRAELDALVDVFGVKCAELKDAVRASGEGT
jgi:hypothetical protein